MRIEDPVAQKENILLGRITKLHGYEGAVTVKLEKNFSENIPQTGSVFLEVEGRPVPFFVEYLEQVRPDTAHLRLEDYDTIEKIREFLGCRVFLTEPVSQDNENTEIENIEGFQVVSAENKIIGTILEIIENPAQYILKVTSNNGKEILIPLHENLVLSLDEKKKTIRMIIPEGLEDL